MTRVMRAYLQLSGHHRRRSGSSHFDEESGPRTERTIYASGVGFGGAILSDFVNTMPPNVIWVIDYRSRDTLPFT